MLKSLKRKLEKKFFFSYVNSEDIFKNVDKELVRTFNFALKSSAYSSIVGKREIRGLNDFKNLPIIDKSIFSDFKLHELCVDGRLPEIEAAFTSSGFSNKFSYGLVTKKDNKKLEGIIRILFDFYWGFKKDVMIINAEAMGVKFSAPFPVIDTSVREDMVVALISALKDYFHNFVIACDPYFAKKIVDFSRGKINLKDAGVVFLVGGSWISNSLYNYLYNESYGLPFVTMGLSELGLNLFHSSPKLAELRNCLQNNEEVRKKLFGDIKTCPELFYYYPKRSYIELIKKNKYGFGEMVFTMNDFSEIPLVRYNSKDIGKLFRSDSLKKFLKKEGLDDFIPEFNLPVAAVVGRSSCKNYGKKEVYVQDVEEALYVDEEIGKRITGMFKLSDNRPLDLQLLNGIKKTRDFKSKVEEVLRAYLGFKISVNLYEYSEFPHQMSLDYERKFNFID